MFMGGVSQEFVQSDDIPGDLNTYTGECEKEVQADGTGHSTGPSSSEKLIPTLRILKVFKIL